MKQMPNWNITSKDYAKYRPGLPLSAFLKLKQLGIGLANQRVLDLGTGTGSTARQFSKQDCKVTAIDNALEQILQAEKLSIEQNLPVKFDVKNCNNMQYECNYFDIVSAVQCWEYINTYKVCTKIKNTLTKSGYLVIINFDEIADGNHIVKATGKLIEKYNPTWKTSQSKSLTKEATYPKSSKFELFKHISYIDKVLYTKESWSGRVRASSITNTILDNKKIKSFNKDLFELIKNVQTDRFHIDYKINMHIFKVK